MGGPRGWWDLGDMGGSWLMVLSLWQLTPEEEEKRRVRRERNKLAAAKCRNRRRELTDRLQAVSSWGQAGDDDVTAVRGCPRRTAVGLGGGGGMAMSPTAGDILRAMGPCL